VHKGYAKGTCVEAVGNIAETRSYLGRFNDQENQSPATSLLRACYEEPTRRPLGF
jgi:hypothetical protein